MASEGIEGIGPYRTYIEPWTEHAGAIGDPSSRVPEQNVLTAATGQKSPCLGNPNASVNHFRRRTEPSSGFRRREGFEGDVVPQRVPESLPRQALDLVGHIVVAPEEKRVLLGVRCLGSTGRSGRRTKSALVATALNRCAILVSWP